MKVQSTEELLNTASEAHSYFLKEYKWFRIGLSFAFNRDNLRDKTTGFKNAIRQLGRNVSLEAPENQGRMMNYAVDVLTHETYRDMPQAQELLKQIQDLNDYMAIQATSSLMNIPPRADIKRVKALKL